MLVYTWLAAIPFTLSVLRVYGYPPTQIPLNHRGNDTVSQQLFGELDELARIVDITYCVGMTGIGIHKPFECLSRCKDFPSFELVTTWNTGPLLSDSCGYIALDHSSSAPRIIVAFRGTYSIANAIVDLSTIPQEYVPYPGRGQDGNAHDDPNPPHDEKCSNCTVHMGFYSSWLLTRTWILAYMKGALESHPGYQVTLVGHSLGGAVAALAALDFHARGWAPRVATFGEPRIGNAAFVRYIDDRFGQVVEGHQFGAPRSKSEFFRVTHAGDPVPLLPLREWGYRMHGGEVFIIKAELPPSVADGDRKSVV